MVKTLVRPVISKIFMMRGSATTTCRSPPSSRHRLSAPTSTPRAVESRKVTPEQVEDQGRLALGDDAVQALAQLRGGRHVDLPADRDHRRRRAPPLFDVEFLIHSTLLRPTGPSGASPRASMQWRLARAFYSPRPENLNLRGFPGLPRHPG